MMPSGYAAELYVHAIAIEREAAERYAEFAARMDQQGNFALTADYSWHDSEAPETAQRHALEIALQAEKRAALPTIPERMLLRMPSASVDWRCALQ